MKIFTEFSIHLAVIGSHGIRQQFNSGWQKSFFFDKIITAAAEARQMGADPKLPQISFFHELADAADKEMAPYFRSSNKVSNKLGEGFDPVTEADRGAETAMRTILDDRFPDHAIFGEEFGHKKGATPDAPSWVLDPLDGTRSFITGMLNWMTLIGFVDDQGAIMGMASQGFTGERFFACKKDGNSWYRAPDQSLVELQTSTVQSLNDAKFCTTTPDLFTGSLLEPYNALKKAVKLTRYSGDAYFYCMLAAGQIDLVVEPGLQSYDIAALIPIVENAGGVITTLDGEPAHHGGNIVAAATPALHQAALNLFS